MRRSLLNTQRLSEPSLKVSTKAFDTRYGGVPLDPELEKMLSSSEGRLALAAVAREMYCCENLDFLNAFFALREQPSLEGATRILHGFFREDAEQPLNVESATRVAMEQLRARLEQGLVPSEQCTCELFLLPFQEVRLMVSQTIWPQFRSKQAQKAIPQRKRGCLSKTEE